MFKVTARDQGHYKGPSGAFVTYCNISCSFIYLLSLYMEFDFGHILLPLFQEGQLSVTGESMCTKYLLTA